MISSSIFLGIKRDRFYLLKHYSLDLAAMTLILVTLYFFTEDTSDLKLSSLIYIIPGILFGLVTAGLLHNTSHNNVKSTLLNRVIGEFCGWWVLYGYKNFVMIHFLHHIYTDKKHDPVNPEGMSFFVFLTAPMRYMIRKTKGWLFEVHGQGDSYHKIMLLQTVLFNLILLARLALWYMVLGKELFFFFYLPGYISNVMIFAHINYICHRELADGSIEIVNLNHNLYYKFANFMTAGGYFHKNHHINPNLFNPRSYKSA